MEKEFEISMSLILRKKNWKHLVYVENSKKTPPPQLFLQIPNHCSPIMTILSTEHIEGKPTKSQNKLICSCFNTACPIAMRMMHTLNNLDDGLSLKEILIHSPGLNAPSALCKNMCLPEHSNATLKTIIPLHHFVNTFWSENMTHKSTIQNPGFTFQ